MSRTVKFLGGTLVGGALGAAIIALLMSEPGEQLQRSVRGRFEEAWAAAQESKRERERELRQRYAIELGKKPSSGGRL